jgi:DNA-directed RNA polymerases I, II, and III subunit RPABC2
MSKKTNDIPFSMKDSKKQKTSQNDEVNILQEEEYVYCEKPRKTNPYMSLYEYSALIDVRALQLGFKNNLPKIDPTEIENYDPLNIAKLEIKRKLLSLVIRRYLPDGSYEDWYAKDLDSPNDFENDLL